MLNVYEAFIKVPCRVSVDLLCVWCIAHGVNFTKLIKPLPLSCSTRRAPSGVMSTFSIIRVSCGLWLYESSSGVSWTSSRCQGPPAKVCTHHVQWMWWNLKMFLPRSCCSTTDRTNKCTKSFWIGPLLRVCVCSLNSTLIIGFLYPGDPDVILKCIVLGFFANAARIHHSGSYRWDFPIKLLPAKVLQFCANTSHDTYLYSFSLPGL